MRVARMAFMVVLPIAVSCTTLIYAAGRHSAVMRVTGATRLASSRPLPRTPPWTWRSSAARRLAGGLGLMQPGGAGGHRAGGGRVAGADEREGIAAGRPLRWAPIAVEPC